MACSTHAPLPPRPKRSRSARLAQTSRPWAAASCRRDLAKLEALLAALKQAPAKTHTVGGCRLQPVGHELGVFRETRRRGLPVLTLCPGERALWDNRFRVELARPGARARDRACAW